MCERALKLGMIVNNLLCTGRLAKLIVLGQGIKSIVRDVELDLFFAELSFFHYLNDNCMWILKNIEFIRARGLY